MKNDDKIVKEEETLTNEVSETEVNESSDTDECTQKLEEVDAKYKRALADYQNLEKRVREERGEWVRAANQGLLLRMLPVLDTLQMAQKHSTDKSLQVTHQLFLDALKAEGVEKIQTIGNQFDPKLMEAVEMIAGEENTVIEERRIGFLLYGKLLRPAEVAVGGKDI